jgi:molybdate transport system substrate-binding protein
MKRLLLALCATWPLLAGAQQLTVSAAASLTDAFKEIAPRFEAARPGATLRFNFAASGVLQQQIAQGAPVDVFASADQDTMNRAGEQRLIATPTRRDFAANSLVLITPAQGAPAVATPVGRYTQQALEATQQWARLQPKLVFADNVRQVLDYVSRGEVEAGFVYRTDAQLLKDKVRIAMTVGGHAPVTYPAAVVADSRQAALARDFLAFLGAAEAQAILAKYGFGKP